MNEQTNEQTDGLSPTRLLESPNQYVPILFFKLDTYISCKYQPMGASPQPYLVVTMLHKMLTVTDKLPNPE